MAKLPLDRYLEWAPGSKKNLNMNHMVPILLDLKCTNKWEYSLQHIPRRKLMETKIFAMQNTLRHNKVNRSSASPFFETFNGFKKPNNRRGSINVKNNRLVKSLFDE